MTETFRLILEFFGPIIGFGVVYYIRSVDKKIDAQDERYQLIANKLNIIDDFMRSELRVMDVRITRIEAHLNLHHQD